jgi:hypothetical protein
MSHDAPDMHVSPPALMSYHRVPQSQLRAMSITEDHNVRVDPRTGRAMRGEKTVRATVKIEYRDDLARPMREFIIELEPVDQHTPLRGRLVLFGRPIDVIETRHPIMGGDDRYLEVVLVLCRFGTLP